MAAEGPLEEMNSKVLIYPCPTVEVGGRGRRESCKFGAGGGGERWLRIPN